MVTNLTVSPTAPVAWTPVSARSGASVPAAEAPVVPLRPMLAVTASDPMALVASTPVIATVGDEIGNAGATFGKGNGPTTTRGRSMYWTPGASVPTAPVSENPESVGASSGTIVPSAPVPSACVSATRS